jgi:hypothetical protein
MLRELSHIMLTYSMTLPRLACACGTLVILTPAQLRYSFSSQQAL